MPDYHLYRINNEGEHVGSVIVRLQDDEAAFSKAREMVNRHAVEVWRDSMRLTVLRPLAARS